MDRQKLLLGLLVLLGLGFGGDWAYRTWVEEPFQKQETEQAKLEKSQADVHDRTVKAKTLARDLVEFEDRSLPANPVVARQAYQAWWWRLLKSQPVANPTVDISQPRPRLLNKSTKKDAQPDLHELAVTVRGVAPLEIVIDLLAEFHQTPFLHRIDGLNLTPINQGRSLSFTVTATALALRTATETEKLPGQSTGTLILAETDPPAESAAAATEEPTEIASAPGAAAALLVGPTETNPTASTDQPASDSAADSQPTTRVTDLAVTTAAPARGATDPTPPITDSNTLPAAETPAATTPGSSAPRERPWQEIVKRNMFAAGGGMTVAKTLKLSAITEDAKGVRQAWFRSTQASATQIVDQGKVLTQGALTAQIVELSDDHAVLLIEGDRVRIQIGQVIADGVALVQNR